jgi:hypothetical protein
MLYRIEVFAAVINISYSVLKLKVLQNKSRNHSHCREEDRKEIYDALIALYRSVSIFRKMFLRNKLSTIHMSETDLVARYLGRITKLATIEAKVEDEELVPISLNRFTPSWKPFVQGICAREKLPSFEKLRGDLVQEETSLESNSARQSEVEDLALIEKMRKENKKGTGKGKKEESSQGRRI